MWKKYYLHITNGEFSESQLRFIRFILFNTVNTLQQIDELTVKLGLSHSQPATLSHYCVLILQLVPTVRNTAI